MGGPGYLEKAQKSIKFYLVTWLFTTGLIIIGAWWLVETYFDFETLMVLVILVGIWLVTAIVAGLILASQVTKPLTALSQAIMHVSPSPLPIAAPQVERLTLAKELVANLTRQVYEFASSSHDASLQTENPLNMVLQQLPVPIIGIDHEANIVFANPKTQEYAKTADSLVGKNLYNNFDILFHDDEPTLEDWIEQCREKSVTAQKIWRGVRMTSYEEETQYCDLAASYVKQSGQNSTEVIMTLFDQTETYGEEDKELSFIALAVHELRAPLTILKGYIEVLDDELSRDLNPEMQDFVQKMQVAAENLTAFVGNILNVARVEQDQLSLKLREEDWKETISSVISNMQLRAKVHGKAIELNVPDGLPKVGIDKVSIAEVLINLIDNAIKYSPHDKTQIKINVILTKDNLVETTVQDFGVGIPESVMPHLFEKYSRNYRNKANITGTGLGLYLSKALIAAHGGNIWVRSKEGEGTIFGFTVVPYDQLADKDKSGDNNGITRSAHGWIKNHSLSRQ
ncbi:MAG TPA: ATP-binding protein [Candidatus Saccharimonadales bacterium]|nr:ATP-binding protein [Candidatus Saccharimonadales bacterium]